MYTLVVVESPYAPKGQKPQENPSNPGRAADCSCKLVMFGDPPHEDCDACKRRLAWWDELHRNLTYARACMKDCLKRGEAPYASHLLYTQEGVLDDTVPDEREWGIKAGFAWRQVAAKTVVYTDLGISKGMEYGILDASKRGCPIEMRSLEGWK